MGRYAITLLLLLALGGACPAWAAESDERVEVFLDETAALFGPSEADIIRNLGAPQERQTVPFTSPHDDKPYEIITLTYDGMVVSLYSMEEGQRQFFHQIRIVAAPVCFARKICRGTTKDRLAAVLGQPEEVEDNQWRYSDMSGYNELAFTFDAAGAVDTLTWTAEAD
ncbi:hypothetical protein [Desulfovibrio sp. TomC]|uniref:hypothetical protein n=1 Tax=Desulfovibrio sp. TomC TaxID=1562888 RepID=UPI0005753AD2|nr:hypothetical protein [Desulfovibrio sp. TomC]KHK01120.1 hypothetical protein NY78_3501 [Desulfovibrio sp. TomC]